MSLEFLINCITGSASNAAVSTRFSTMISVGLILDALPVSLSNFNAWPASNAMSTILDLNNFVMSFFVDASLTINLPLSLVMVPNTIFFITLYFYIFIIYVK